MPPHTAPRARTRESHAHTAPVREHRIPIERVAKGALQYMHENRASPVRRMAASAVDALKRAIVQYTYQRVDALGYARSCAPVGMMDDADWELLRLVRLSPGILADTRARARYNKTRRKLDALKARLENKRLITCTEMV